MIKIKISNLLILISIFLFFFGLNTIKSNDYKTHNEYYMSIGDKSNSTSDLIDNGNSTSNKRLNMTVALFNEEIYIEQKYIYFLYENIFRVNNIVPEINEITLMKILSSLNILVFILFIFNKLKLPLIHIVYILLLPVITLVANRGMGIYFYGQSISGRFI